MMQGRVPNWDGWDLARGEILEVTKQPHKF
jgi:hypothetical protein